MKSVLMSIRPEWVAKILNGEKTIEVRKTCPKLKTPFKVYIYCTKSGQKLYNNKSGQIPMLRMFGLLTDKHRINGKVVAEFTCDKIDEIPCDSEAHKSYRKESCLTLDDFINYCNGESLYGWHISDLKVYDEPKELYELKRQNPCYWSKYEITDEGVDAENCWENCTAFDSKYCDGKCSELEKAPQSWCYIQEEQ